MENPKQIFLFLSHDASKKIVKEYRKILRATAGIGTTVFLYHAKSDNLPALRKEEAYYVFSDESLSALGYPMTEPWFNLHTHFALLRFFRDNPDFDYYWLIEYDVRFSGDWRLFFDFFTHATEDFLSCHIRKHAEEPDWLLWPLHHPVKSIPASERLRSFNTVYRLSQSSLSFLDRALREGWYGHQEVLIPTLMYHNGFIIKDLGGSGSFTPPGMENRFYTSSRADRRGALQSGTMRFRPCFWRAGLKRNMLYHPVKPLASAIRENMRYHNMDWRFKRMRRRVKRVRRRLRGFLVRRVKRIYSRIRAVTRFFCTLLR